MVDVFKLLFKRSHIFFSPYSQAEKSGMKMCVCWSACMFVGTCAHAFTELLLLFCMAKEC